MKPQNLNTIVKVGTTVARGAKKIMYEFVENGINKSFQEQKDNQRAIARSLQEQQETEQIQKALLDSKLSYHQETTKRTRLQQKAEFKEVIDSQEALWNSFQNQHQPTLQLQETTKSLKSEQNQASKQENEINEKIELQQQKEKENIKKTFDFEEKITNIEYNIKNLKTKKREKNIKTTILNILSLGIFKIFKNKLINKQIKKLKIEKIKIKEKIIDLQTNQEDTKKTTVTPSTPPYKHNFDYKSINYEDTVTPSTPPYKHSL